MYRVYGPYREKRRKRVKWRVELVGADGQAEVSRFETEAEAQGYAAAQKRVLVGGVIVGDVLDKYEAHLKRKGNKDRSVGLTILRLKGWLPAGELLNELSERRIASIYEKRCSQVLLDKERKPLLGKDGSPRTIAADTHRNELAEVKSFFRWCVERKLLKRSPAEGIKAIGRRSRGKAQLRRAEAQKFSQTALRLAQGGDEGAVAALMVLWLGMRSDEIRSRVARDVDVTDESTWLWIDEGKTEAARRHMDVPEPLAGLLKKRAKGKLPGGYLFPAKSADGYRSRTWLIKVVARICRAAGVPRIPPHGLRGTWSTLAEDAGAVGHLVAQQLGHESHRTTEQHYLEPGVEERAKAKRAQFRLVGGSGQQK